MSITENFMEDHAFHEQQRAEYEYRMFELFIEEKEKEEQEWLRQAPQYFYDLQQYEKSII
jgi:hypothetical protein